MTTTRFVFLLLLARSATAATSPKDSEFVCPEVSGLFPDPIRCDLHYVCEKGVAKVVECEDGLVFDQSVRNHERCTLPHNVDCGDRTELQEPKADIDPKCLRANGFFDHEDPAVCDKFYSCDKGSAFEMPCTQPLHFDSKVGSCVRKEQLSTAAKRCEGHNKKVQEVDGFTCPGHEEIGPQGLLHQHPVYPHPTDCQFFFSCVFGKEPLKLGCSTGQVFDAKSQICKAAKEVPECGCWHECHKDSKCPVDCNADCSCPAAAA